MRLAAALILACAALPAQAAPPESDQPLLTLARTQWEKQSPDDLPTPGNDAVRAAEHELAQARVPPDAECAHSLGAQRFASLHLRLGKARQDAGEFAAAAAALRRAQACRPRETGIHALLADALFAARDYAAARSAVDAGLGVDPRSPELYRQAGELAFVAGSWAEAAARFRYVAAAEPERSDAEFAQLMFWLAQRRAGVPRPQLVERTHDDEWPRPLVRYVEGEISEETLTLQVSTGDNDNYDAQEQPSFVTSRRLCQALFYVGEARWAQGDLAQAREYLAAAINLKAFDLPEHQLALAEIAHLRP